MKHDDHGKASICLLLNMGEELVGLGLLDIFALASTLRLRVNVELSPAIAKERLVLDAQIMSQGILG